MRKKLLKYLALVLATCITLTSVDVPVMAAANTEVVEEMTDAFDVSFGDVSLGDVSACDVSDNMITTDTQDEFVSGGDVSASDIEEFATEESVEESTTEETEVVEESSEETTEESATEETEVVEEQTEESVADVSGNEAIEETTEESTTEESVENTEDAAQIMATNDGVDVLDVNKLQIMVNKYGVTRRTYGEDNYISGYDYTGKEIKPAITVTYNGKKLKNKTDYTITYKNNVNAVPGYFVKDKYYYDEFFKEYPTIVVKGKGKYSELEKEEQFYIFRKNVNPYGYDFKITNLVSNMDMDATTDREIPNPTVKYGKVTLEEGKDYKLYLGEFVDNNGSGYFKLNNIPAGLSGTGKLYMKLIGNYTNTYNYSGMEDYIELTTISIASEDTNLKNATVKIGGSAKNVKIVRLGVGRSTYYPTFGVYDEVTKKYYKVEDGQITKTEVKAKDIVVVYFENADKTKTYLVYGKDFYIEKKNTHTADTKHKAFFNIVGMGNYTGIITNNVVNPIYTKATNKTLVEWDAFRSTFEYGEYYGFQEFDFNEESYGFKIGGMEFDERTDFTVTFTPNTDAGTKTATINFKKESGYIGSISKTYKVLPVDINRANVDITVGNLFYDAKKPNVNVNVSYFLESESNKHYKLVTKKDKNTMTLKVTVSGIKGKNFFGSVTREYPMIPKVSLTKDMFNITNDEYILLGRKNLVIEATKNLPTSFENGSINYNDYELANKTDYTVKYVVDKRNSAMVVTITGKGYFANTLVYTYPMAYVTVTEDMFEVEESVPYTNSSAGAKAQVKGHYKSLELAEGTDYSLTYTNNKVAGTATVEIKGKGNFSGSIVKTYTVEPMPIYNADISVASIDYNSSKEKFEPAVTVKLNGVKLTVNKDYKVTYNNNTKDDFVTKKNPMVTIEGINNFYGNLTNNFTINYVPFDEAIVEVERAYYGASETEYKKLAKVTYNGTELKLDKDFKVTTEVIEHKDTLPYTKEGTITITPIGKCLGTAITKELKFYHETINNKKVYAVIKEGTNYYTGEQVKPEIEKMMFAGYELDKEIIYGIDYIITNYGTNTTIGNRKGSMTIEGVNYYGGSATIVFDIYQENKYTGTTYNNISEGQTTPVEDALKYVNKYRKASGLPEIVSDPKLEEVARQRAIIYVKEYEDDVPHQNMVNSGECLAGPAAHKLSAEELIKLWYDSPGHRKTLLREDVVTMGCAAYMKNGKYYYCYVVSKKDWRETQNPVIDTDKYTLIYTDEVSGYKYWLKNTEIDAYKKLGYDIVDTIINRPAYREDNIRTGCLIIEK